MTTAQLDHLKRIDAHLDKLLEIAAKRTEGRWDIEPHRSWDKDFTVGPVIIDYDDVDHDEQDANATFIASCAGNAEAGWMATRAAIAHLCIFQYAAIPMSDATRTLLETILAAFPLEILEA